MCCTVPLQDDSEKALLQEQERDQWRPGPDVEMGGTIRDSRGSEQLSVCAAVMVLHYTPRSEFVDWVSSGSEHTAQNSGGHEDALLRGQRAQGTTPGDQGPRVHRS